MEEKSGFVFTSSAGVFSEDGGGEVNEYSPVGSSPRAQRLLDCEEIVTSNGGSVLRLAGLYLLRRGAHNAYLNMEEVNARPDGLINQIHYDDAATATVAALMKGEAGGIYVAADDKPMSREDICATALDSPVFRGCKKPHFASSGDNSPTGLGKRIDCQNTREKLGWKPRHSSFSAFIKESKESE